MIVSNCTEYDPNSDTFVLVKDEVFEQPLCLYIAVTNECNFSCNFCFNKYRSYPPFNISTMMQNIALMANWFPLRIVITGGEPLLCPKLGHFCSILKDLGNTVIVATNGFLLDSLDKNFFHFVDWFDISIPTIDQNIFTKIRGQNCISHVLNNLLELSSHGVKLKLSVLADNDTLPNLRETIDYLLRIPNSEIRIQSLLSATSEIKSTKKRQLFDKLKDKYRTHHKVTFPEVLTIHYGCDNGYLYCSDNLTLFTFKSNGDYCYVQNYLQDNKANDLLRKIIQAQFKMFRVAKSNMQ